MNVEDELESFFMLHDYRWRIDGTLRFPTADDIRMTIDRAIEELYDERVGTQLEVGRLIIKKTPKHFDIYVRIGEAHDKDS